MDEAQCKQEMLCLFLAAGEPLERAQELVERMGQTITERANDDD
jgi:hypothetical protein